MGGGVKEVKAGEAGTLAGATGQTSEGGSASGYIRATLCVCLFV